MLKPPLSPCNQLFLNVFVLHCRVGKLRIPPFVGVVKCQNGVHPPVLAQLARDGGAVLLRCHVNRLVREGEVLSARTVHVCSAG